TVGEKCRLGVADLAGDSFHGLVRLTKQLAGAFHSNPTQILNGRLAHGSEKNTAKLRFRKTGQSRQTGDEDGLTDVFTDRFEGRQQSPKISELRFLGVESQPFAM